MNLDFRRLRNVFLLFQPSKHTNIIYGKKKGVTSLRTLCTVLYSTVVQEVSCCVMVVMSGADVGLKTRNVSSFTFFQTNVISNEIKLFLQFTFIIINTIDYSTFYHDFKYRYATFYQAVFATFCYGLNTTVFS